MHPKTNVQFYYAYSNECDKNRIVYTYENSRFFLFTF